MMRRIKTTSIHDVEYVNLLNKLQKDEVNLNGTEFRVDQKGLIRFKERIYMPGVADLKLFILNEMHKPPYAGHLGYQNMITSLTKQFIFPRLKVELVDYLSKFLECQ